MDLLIEILQTIGIAVAMAVAFGVSFVCGWQFLEQSLKLYCRIRGRKYDGPEMFF